MAELPDFDPYSVLGVDKIADANDIKKAYRKLALLKHPDKCGGDEELKKLRTDEFQRLNEAYDILNDDERRQRHDALVRLEKLRKEKANLARGGPPRPFMRASTFASTYPAPTATATATAYTSRGPANVEDRAPRFFDDDDLYSSRRTQEADDYHTRRSAEKPSRAERARPAPEREAVDRRRAERRREAERRRDADIRSSRSGKKEYEEERLRSRSWEERLRDDQERSRRGHEDPLRQKYSAMEETAQSYTGARTAEPRPGMTRRNSTRDVPRPPVMARRSRASPKERTLEETQRELERDRQIRAELGEKVREKERSKSERAARAQQAEREAEREAERQNRERQRAEADRYERDRAREKEDKKRERELLEQERVDLLARQERQRGREYPTVRSKKDDTVEPYEKRPPILQHHNSLPPFGSAASADPHGPPRSRTEPTSPYASPNPTLSRSSTMPVQSNSSARRSAPPPSKLREGVLQDPGYSSSGTAASIPEPRPKPKVKTYSYPRMGEDDEVSTSRYATQTREPGPSKLASQFAAMAPVSANSGRRSTAHGAEKAAHVYSSRGAPHPEAAARREWGRDGRSYREDEFDGASPRMYSELPSPSPMTSHYGDPTYSSWKDPYDKRPGSSRRMDTDSYRSYPRAGTVQS
jgi:curved DNA-binding protein CbpA